MTPELPAILEQLAEFDTALLANTIGYIDTVPDHEFYMGGSIASVTPNLGPTVGVAVVCEIDSSTPRKKADWGTYDQMVDEGRGRGMPQVLVAKASGSRPDHECILGDGMAKELHSAGFVGIVTDGGARDIEGLLTVPFAAYCRGRTVHHTPVRFRRPASGAVEIGGISVADGDVIHANIGGVIKIPASSLARLPERAVAMRAFENDAHRFLRRTDLRQTEKQEAISALLAKYGFASPH